MNQKSYKLQTVQAVRFLIKDQLNHVCTFTVGQAVRHIEKHSLIDVSRSTIRNIIGIIMADMVKAGRAEKLHRGAWAIKEYNNPMDLQLGSSGQPMPKFLVNELQPVVFNPSLTKFLDPPKPTPEVDIYNELKKLKGQEKSRWDQLAIKMCMEANISITRLINYINEKRNHRAVETAGLESVQS